MSPRELHRQAAATTGETVSEISRRGFSLANPDEANFDPEPYGAYVDWDALDAQRCALLPG